MEMTCYFVLCGKWSTDTFNILFLTINGARFSLHIYLESPQCGVSSPRKVLQHCCEVIDSSFRSLTKWIILAPIFKVFKWMSLSLPNKVQLITSFCDLQKLLPFLIQSLKYPYLKFSHRLLGYTNLTKADKKQLHHELLSYHYRKFEIYRFRKSCRQVSY